MRTDAPSPAELNGSLFSVAATITRGGVALAGIPVVGGKLIWQQDQSPATRISGVTVPYEYAGKSISELADASGERITLTATAETSTGTRTFELGTFLATSVYQTGALCVIDGEDLTRLILDHEYGTPRPVGTSTTARMLLTTLLGEDGIRAEFGRELMDAKLPSDFTLGTDRGKAFADLLDALGAYAIAGPHVDLRILPIDNTAVSAVAEYTDQTGGTIVGAEIKAAREAVFNHVVVTSNSSDLLGEAMQTDGRYAVDGPFGYRTLRVSNAPVSSVQQATLAARAQLLKAVRRSRVVPVEMVPDYRLEPGDLVAVTANGERMTGHVTGLEIPLTAHETMIVHIGTEG